VDVRIIATSNRDLKKEVEQGNFREDLFYRLYVIPIMMPTLKERKSDISFLVSHFLDQFGRKVDSPLPKVSDSAMKILMNYSWPGNVRELKNIIERLVVLHENETILPEDLPEKLRIENDRVAQRKLEAHGGGISFNTAVNEFEKALIISALEKTNWVKNRAAKLLKIKRTTLVEKIKRYNLEKYSEEDR
jgi:DNA-binding NtrC family response regulator